MVSKSRRAISPLAHSLFSGSPILVDCSSTISGSRAVLRHLGGLRPNAVFLLSKFRGKFRAEIFRLEYLANLDLAVLVMRVGAAFDPLDRLLFRRDFPQPEPGDQLLGLGKRSVNDRARASRKLYPCSF